MHVNQFIAAATVALVVQLGAPAAHGESFRLGIDVAALPQNGGCQVLRVAPGGVGDRMGLKQGDVILRANGKKVVARSEILQELATEHIDVIWRRGDKFYLASAALATTTPEFERPRTVTLVDQAVEVDEAGMPIAGNPPAAGPAAIPPALAPADQPLRLGIWTRTAHFANGDAAAQVTRVELNSPSQRLIQVGDASGKRFRIVPNDNYILEVNGVAVHGHEELQRLVAAASETVDLRVYNPVTGKDAHYLATLR